MAAPPAPGARASRRGPVALLVLALLGVGLLLYPSGATWFAALTTDGQLDAYMERVEQIDPEARDAALAAAEQYNSDGVQGLVIDPFSNTPGASEVPMDEAAYRYLDQLALDPEGVMSRVTITSVGIDLPVYHGTTDETLHRGAGHLYGSSLPVGGSDTHAVITGHSGLPQAAMFTALHEVERGDEIIVTTLGRTMTYRIVLIDRVTPTDIADLAVEPGRDLLTLVTCTPIGINTHRLIVQAERVPNAGEQAAEVVETQSIPFPWWMIAAAGALGGWGYAVVKVTRRNEPPLDKATR
ncbi:class C sortase [Microbacterium sediminis]|uniref:Class C sortase n=1 Tax=Microbacterium sediminis TaxID=904291 RepID=A0A1B9NAH7_9MICO|nr:class C sortase [Microbacterium sediminis]OCG73590.1 hypothetical protein A7J15_07920 [Microbacterium sediminis]